MPKKLPSDLNEQILTELKRHPDGVRLGFLEGIFAKLASRRSLQRRLSNLIADGLVAVSGQGRNRIFVTNQTQTAKGDSGLAVNPNEAAIEMTLPLSQESREIQSYVCRPLHERKPVAYDGSLLEAYLPNNTHYLTKSIREHLGNIGRSPGGARPAGTYARQIMDRLLIDLSWASSRLEGNTYSRLDTKALIHFGHEAKGKDRIETQMILNHKAAIEMIIDNAEEVRFNQHTFLNLHAILSDNLLSDTSESGRVRNRLVGIGGSVFHPLNNPHLLQSYFHMMLEKADLIHDPFEQSFFVTVHFPYLQPFIDVNKRVSRVGANIPLIKQNLSPLSFVDVPERAYVEGILGVYELQRFEILRDVYTWAYERSCQQYLALKETIAEPDPFRLRYRETLAKVIGEIVRGQRSPTRVEINAVAKMSVVKRDLEQFVSMAIEDLNNLHEGNIGRYRLRISEYRAWQPLQRSSEF